MTSKIVRSLLFLVLAAAAACVFFFLHPFAGPRPNVLLIVVDTLRADRLSCYGFTERTSPNIDRLASEGVLVERMLSQVPQTLPSFSTILTGTYPVTHGVRTNGIFALPDSALTLAELFRGRGYKTAAFIGGFPLDSQFGIGQGFETYEDTMRSRRPMDPKMTGRDGSLHWLGHATECFENKADIITKEAVDWLEKNAGGAPFFAMVHYFDPHNDYVPPERFKRLFSHPYLGEVAFVDDQIGRLLAALDSLCLEKNTLVVLTADHGECLGEFGRTLHQTWLVEATLHVPFMARMPGVLPAARRVPGLCRSVDIMPTILDLAGAPVPDTVEGKSILPGLLAGRIADRPCYAETLFGKLEAPQGITRVALTVGKWRFVRHERKDPQSGKEASLTQLFDLESDPDERRNGAERFPEKTENLRARLEAFLEAHPPGRAQVVTPDESAIEKLKSLGYF